MAHSTERDIRAIWNEYGRNHSEQARNLLMEHYLPLVRNIAQRVHAKLPREVELDDLVSAGVFGLMYAIAAFDPQRSVKFETYCAGRIRGAILDELRSLDWVPRLARLRAQKLVSATHQFRLEHGRDPTSDELAQRLQVSVGELRKITRDGSLVKVMPLSRQPTGGDMDEQQSLDFLEDKRESEGLRIGREDLRRLIRQSLSRAEQLILILYYFERMTMKEIGLTLDLSESRVSQMHSMILARLNRQVEGRSHSESPTSAAA